MNWLIVADKKPRRDKKMSELKLNTPIKLNEAEECECCGGDAFHCYKPIAGSQYNTYCDSCLKLTQESDKEYLEARLEEIEEENTQNYNYDLVEEIENEIEGILSDKNIVYNKIKSRMSLSVYFELDNFKIRISDHASRPTYNVINGEADFTVGVGFEDGFLDATVFKKDEIKDVLKKLLKKLAV